MIGAVVERAGDQLGAFLPRIVGALLLLVVGLLLAIVLGRLTRRGLVRAGLDRFADRTGTNELLSQAGLGSSLAALLGTAVRITIVVIASVVRNGSTATLTCSPVDRAVNDTTPHWSAGRG